MLLTHDKKGEQFKTIFLEVSVQHFLPQKGFLYACSTGGIIGVVAFCSLRKLFSKLSQEEGSEVVNAS